MKSLPKNKELFKKLIPFAKGIISICQDNGLSPIIYGSFAHFYYTQDKNMKEKVNMSLLLEFIKK